MFTLRGEAGTKRLIFGLTLIMLMVSISAQAFNVGPTSSPSATIVVPKDYSIIQTAAEAISQEVSVVEWDWNIPTMYCGLPLGQATLSQVQAAIDSKQLPWYYGVGDYTWEGILYWYFVIRKYDLFNATTVEWALNNASMMTNGLPVTTASQNCFSVSERYVIWGYYWAQQLGYETSKWNATKAYSNFATALNNTGTPVLCVYGNDTTFIGSVPRYYDETAESIDVFLEFYMCGVAQGLNDALRWSNWMNNHLWDGDHYGYAVGSNVFEGEAGFMEQVMWKLYYLYPSMENVTRLTIDCFTRYLANLWNSYQWCVGANTSAYVAVHAYQTNSERRLGMTLGAWSAILGLYSNMTSSGQTYVQELLNGSASPSGAPAWQLLFSSNAGLYGQYTELFKWTSGTNDATDAAAYATNLILRLAVCPVTGSMAMPLEEVNYEYRNTLVDFQQCNINLMAHTLTIPVMDNGSFFIMLGSTPFMYTIQSQGIWQLTLTSDWNNVVSANEISDLPTNRMYLGTYDTVPPTFSRVSTSIALAGQSCTFQTTITDNVGLSGYYFSNNDTGKWVNDTWTACTSNPQTISTTETLNGTSGTVVSYIWYANDTSNNWSSFSNSLQVDKSSGGGRPAYLC